MCFLEKVLDRKRWDEMREVRHCLSFDIEEHFQVSNFASTIPRGDWERLESRVERNVYRILDLLSNRSVRATFFVLGWVAERHPQLIRRLAAAGHEVASHGYGHQLVTEQRPAVFRDDVRKAKAVLEDIIGQPVLGYRAPSFTIKSETQWALPILVEEGYVYDSSIFPVIHDRYGMPGAVPWCHEISTTSGILWEVPPSTYGILGGRFPVAGGGYFRLVPYSLLRLMLRRVVATGNPLVMYLHPWELDPEQPRMDGPLFSRFRHYLNIEKTEPRLRALLSDFRFGPVRDAIVPIRERIATFCP